MNLSDYRDEEPDYGDPLADDYVMPEQPARRSTRSIYAPIGEAERARVRCEKRVAGAYVRALARKDAPEMARLRRMLDERPWQYDPWNWTAPGLEGSEAVMDAALKAEPGKLGDLVRSQMRPLQPTEPLDAWSVAERKQQLRRQAEALGATTAKGD